MTATNPPIVRIGARGSPLSLAQTRLVQAMVATALGAPDRPDEVAPIIPIVTTGDRVQDRRLMDIGGKGLFTKEIEEALLDGRIDCAVHSLKDMPGELPGGLVIAANPPREDVRDAFISNYGALADLPPKSVLGTASLRRQAQCLRLRPDLKIVMLRGNVDTRIAKLDAGEADAILLAMSGLKRLGRTERVRSLLDPYEAPPAPGQGALAIETRAEDAAAPWVQALRHRPTMIEIAAERGALLALEGSCRTAVGAYAKLADGRLTLAVEALTDDGAQRWREEATLDGADEASARALGLEIGQKVRTASAGKLAW